MARKPAPARTVGDIIADLPAPNHNGGPPLDALPAIKAKLDDLEGEARNWLDGAEVADEAQAADVSRLIDAARKVAKEAEEARKVEKQPHADAAKAVDERWKPLTAACDRIAQVAKAALTPFLVEQDRRKREAEAEARRVAEAAAAEARRKAEEAARSASLDAAEARDAAIEEAERKAREASQAARDTANAKGAGMTRAIGLRTIWRSLVEDRRALLNFVAANYPADLEAFLDDWAAARVRTGVRELPGVKIYEERSAA